MSADRDKPKRDPRPLAFRLAAPRQAKINLAEIWSRPKCTAIGKTTGEQCRNPVVTGKTKCRLHGGSVPSGKQWHRVQRTGDPERDARKAADVARRKTKQAARVAAMSPEERAAYRKWQRTHAPTSPSDRERGRADRKAAEANQKRWNAPPAAATPSDEALQLAEIRAALEARIGEFAAIAEAADPAPEDGADLVFPTKGVFG